MNTFYTRSSFSAVSFSLTLVPLLRARILHKIVDQLDYNITFQTLAVDLRVKADIYKTSFSRLKVFYYRFL